MKIDQYIKLKQITYLQAAKDLSTDYTTVYRWIHKGSMPRPSMLKKIRLWSDGAVTANDFAT